MNENKTDNKQELSLATENRQISIKHGENGQLMLYENGQRISLNERETAKLEMLLARNESEKAARLISKLTGKSTDRTDIEKQKAAISNSKEKPEKETELNKTSTNRKNENEEKHERKPHVTSAQITGIAAGGDFHLSMRIQDDETGKTYDRKGVITGLDAAALRSNNNMEKDGIVLRNAQSIASENFEKGMAALVVRNNTNGMKLD